jgi:hypothetical protein
VTELKLELDRPGVPALRLPSNDKGKCDECEFSGLRCPLPDKGVDFLAYADRLRGKEPEIG